MLATDIAEPAQTEWPSPIFIVHRTNENITFFRRLAQVARGMKLPPGLVLDSMHGLMYQFSLKCDENFGFASQLWRLTNQNWRRKSG